MFAFQARPDGAPSRYDLAAGAIDHGHMRPVRERRGMHEVVRSNLPRVRRRTRRWFPPSPQPACRCRRIRRHAAPQRPRSLLVIPTTPRLPQEPRRGVGGFNPSPRTRSCWVVAAFLHDGRVLRFPALYARSTQPIPRDSHAGRIFSKDDETPTVSAERQRQPHHAVRESYTARRFCRIGHKTRGLSRQPGMPKWWTELASD